MIGRSMSLAAGALLAFSTASSAQGGARKAERVAARVEARGGRGGNQQALAAQVRQAFAGVVRQRLNLTDDQARQLQATQQRFQQQRTQLQRDERQTRLGLKAAMADSTGTPDQNRVSQYMDQLVQGQHRRAAILEAEQKELAGYLTPLQRAKYLSLHEQLNKRIQQMQQKGAATGTVPTP